MGHDSARGRFVWYDLMTTDVEAAQAFYGHVVGWTTAPWGDGPMPYTMWMAGETPIGGVMALSDAMRAGGAPPHWMAYICVPDADATAAQAVSLGGKIVVPGFDIKDVGRIVICGDPQGGAFAVYTPSGDAPGHEGPAGLHEFSWHELMTTDHPAAFGFYSTLFGWQKAGDFDMGPMGTYQMFSRADGMPIGGMMKMPAEQPFPAWFYYVCVDDVHAGVERAKAKGGQVVHGPTEVPGGDWVVMMTDPQGAFFALHHRKPA